MGSEIPGNGSLAPPLEPVLPEMLPGDAIAVALYHWLKNLGPDVNLKKFNALMASQWNVANMYTNKTEQKHYALAPPEDDSLTPVNSCLMRDTGAREYAILNQTGLGGVGQAGLARAFGIYNTIGPLAQQEIYPQSALPILIDALGNVNLAGRRGFDKSLIKEYCRMCTAQTLQPLIRWPALNRSRDQSSTVLRRIEQRIFIARQAACHHKQPAQPPWQRAEGNKSILLPKPQVEHIEQLARERSEALRTGIRVDEEELKRYWRIKYLASSAEVERRAGRRLDFRPVHPFV